MQSRLIHETIFATAEEYPYRPAFWIRADGDFQPMSYRDLAARVIDTAAGLAKLEIAPGDRVAIYAGNSPDWCVVYLAVLAAGGVVVPLDSQLKYFELRSLIGEAQLKALFCESSQQEKLGELSVLVSPHPTIISIDNNGGQGISLGQVRNLGADTEFQRPRVDPKSLAVLIFTSGTSGESKGVMLSHSNITSDVQACREYMPIFPEDRFLSVLPLHHTFEATCGFIYPLSVGASISHVLSLKSSQLGDDIRALRATLMCAVPLLYEKLYLRIGRGLAQASALKRFYVSVGLRVTHFLKRVMGGSPGRVIFRQLRNSAGLGSLRMLISGGAAINPAISEFFCDIGIDLLQGYGLTETSPVLSVNRADDNCYASVGRPLPGVEVRIIEPDSNGVGEIAARGKMVMLGYYQNEEATGAAITDGFFHTGDLGCLDSKGFLHITGRKKNVIVTAAGKNIYPEEIEAALDDSPYILESAVLPRKRGTGEEPIAVVVPDYEIVGACFSELSGNQIKELVISEVSRVSGQLAEFKRLKRVIVMTEELPKTSTRKIKKYVLIDNLKKMGEL